MNLIPIYLSSLAIIFALMTALYYTFNKGLSLRSKHQQGSRFLITSALASLPVAVAGVVPGTAFITVAVVSLLWATVYPVTYHLSYRNSTSDYDNYADITLGAYLWGLLSACHILVGELPRAATLLAFIEIVAAFLPVAQLVYFLLYRVCIDTNGMKAIQESHINEILEFSRSFSPIKTVVLLLLIIALCGSCIVFNTHHTASFGLSTIQISVLSALLLFYVFYIFVPKHCIFSRTGFVTLWNNIKDYSRRNSLYRTGMEERLKGLQATPLVPFGDTPHTIVMVIGESASRDYMSAFTPQPREPPPGCRKRNATRSTSYCSQTPTHAACRPYLHLSAHSPSATSTTISRSTTHVPSST